MSADQSSAQSYPGWQVHECPRRLCACGARRLVRLQRPLACTTCSAMSWNGLKTAGMNRTQARLPLAPPGALAIARSMKPAAAPWFTTPEFLRAGYRSRFAHDYRSAHRGISRSAGDQYSNRQSESPPMNQLALLRSLFVLTLPQPGGLRSATAKHRARAPGSRTHRGSRKRRIAKAILSLHKSRRSSPVIQRSRHSMPQAFSSCSEMCERRWRPAPQRRISGCSMP